MFSDVIASPGICDPMTKSSFIDLVATYASERLPSVPMARIREATRNEVEHGTVSQMDPGCMSRGMARILSERIIMDLS